MTRGSLATRTTLAFTGTALLLLAVFGAASWLLVRTRGLQGIDETLRARAQAAATLCEWDDEFETDLSETLAAELGCGPEGGLAIYVAPGPEPLFRAGTSIGSSYETLTATAANRTSRDGCWRIRAALHPFPEQAESHDVPRDLALRIVTWQSLARLDADLASLAWTLTLSGIGCGLLAFGLASFLSRRVVGPLAALGRAAPQVASGTLDQLPRTGHDDEIDTLAGLLESAFAEQRAALQRQARFTADAAHELNNPIASIRTAAEVAGHASRSAEEREAFLADIQATAERMGATVRALLELARLDGSATALQRQPCSLAELLDELAPDVPRTGEADIVTRGDRRLLAVLLRNLLDNARRHARTRVEVELLRDAEGHAICRIADDGPGPGVDDPQQLFERFRRAAPAAGGSGLGLAIVAEIARVHGGSVRFLEVAAGTTVEVRLPAAA